MMQKAGFVKLFSQKMAELSLVVSGSAVTEGCQQKNHWQYFKRNLFSCVKSKPMVLNKRHTEPP